MFFRSKKSGSRTYLQIVENRWEDGQARQQVLATLGRLDQLLQDGQLDALLLSGARFSQTLLLLSAHVQGRYCQMLWMTAASGGFSLLHPIDKLHPGDHL